MSKKPLVVKLPLAGEVTIQPGKIVTNPGVEDWEFLVEVPEESAQIWIFKVAPQAQHSVRGFTVETTTITKWEVGRGIVIEANSEALLALVRTEKKMYWLIRARDLSKLSR